MRHIHGDLPRLLPGAFCPMIPGLLVPRPGASCHGGGARQLTCNHLGNNSSQAYEVKIKDWPLWKNMKMSEVRYHICAGKAGNLGQEMADKMHFLWRLAPPYPIFRCVLTSEIECFFSFSRSLLGRKLKSIIFFFENRLFYALKP